MKQIHEALSKEEIPFLLVGGFAVNYYGYTRNTIDIDFMTPDENVAQLKSVMQLLGFSNVSEHENVIFFNKPATPFRIDFLIAEKDTMNRLMEKALPVDFQDIQIQVVALKDLLAMKLFAMMHGSVVRKDKDLLDVAYLTVLNELDLERDIRPLSMKYASDAVFEIVKSKVEAVRSS